MTISKKKGIDIFKAEYSRVLKKLVEEAIEYKHNMVSVMKKTDLKTFNSKEDYIDTAHKAVYHKIHSEYQAEAAIDLVNQILNDKNNDNKEESEI